MNTKYILPLPFHYITERPLLQHTHIEISEVFVVVQRIAHQKLIGNLKASV
jgi:hypothetical protein